jgi:hypothetical protein
MELLPLWIVVLGKSLSFQSTVNPEASELSKSRRSNGSRRRGRLLDPGLEYLETGPLMDPLRQEPRFHGIERELKFPS